MVRPHLAAPKKTAKAQNSTKSSPKSLNWAHFIKAPRWTDVFCLKCFEAAIENRD